MTAKARLVLALILVQLLVVGLPGTGWGTIIGDDDRKLVPPNMRFAKSVGMIMERSCGGLKEKGDGSFEVLPEKKEPICKDQKFDEMAPAKCATCSVVLVSPTLALTAGHCLKAHSDDIDGYCKDLDIVFGFHQDRKIPADKKTGCSKILKWGSDENEDFALIQLDPPMSGEMAASVDFEWTPKTTDQLANIGHSKGLPMVGTRGTVDRVDTARHGPPVDGKAPPESRAETNSSKSTAKPAGNGSATPPKMSRANAQLSSKRIRTASCCLETSAIA